MGASSDFYKKLALDCSAQQIAVDLFVFSNPKRFVDLTTLCEATPTTYCIIGSINW